MSKEGNQAKLIEFIDSIMRTEFTESRSEETTGLYVTDLTKEPEDVARNLAEKKLVSFANFSTSLGRQVEWVILNAIKWRKEELKDFNIEYGTPNYKVCLAYMELGLTFNGAVDYLAYTVDREKIPIEIKSLSQKRYYDASVKNKEKIQLMAYIKGLQSPYGLLVRVNRNNGVYSIEILSKDNELVIGRDAKSIPFWVHCRQWATRFHAERARIVLDKERDS